MARLGRCSPQLGQFPKPQPAAPATAYDRLVCRFARCSVCAVLTVCRAAKQLAMLSECMHAAICNASKVQPESTRLGKLSHPRSPTWQLKATTTASATSPVECSAPTALMFHFFRSGSHSGLCPLGFPSSCFMQCLRSRSDGKVIEAALHSAPRGQTTCHPAAAACLSSDAARHRNRDTGIWLLENSDVRGVGQLLAETATRHPYKCRVQS